MIQKLDLALDRLEAALAAREAEGARLRRIETAATEALADLEMLIQSAGQTVSKASAGHDRIPA